MTYNPQVAKERVYEQNGKLIRCDGNYGIKATDVRWIKFDTDKVEYKFVQAKGKKVSQIVREHGADFGFNLPYFMGNGYIYGDVKIDGKVVGQTSESLNTHFAIKNGKPTIGKNLNVNDPSITDLFQAKPLITEPINGVSSDCYHYYRQHQNVLPDIINAADTVRAQRTFIGLDKKGDLIVAVGDGRTTSDQGLNFREMALFLRGKGAEIILNGDGGGSSTLADKTGSLGQNRGGNERVTHHAILVFVKKNSPTNPTPSKKTRFVIDAGHGSETAGKRSPDSTGLLREFHFNLPTANKVVALLNQYENVEILITHDANGRDVPLAERVNKIVQWGKSDLLVSIHANASGTGWNDANGVETYTDTDKQAPSAKLANAIQSEMIKATGLRNRGVKKADFMIIYGSSANKQFLKDYVPARALVECGFMTNKNEAALLKTSAYQDKIANAIVKGIVDAYGLKKKIVDNPTSTTLYRVQVGAFSVKSNATNLSNQLKAQGYATIIVIDGGLYRVQVGAFSVKNNAENLERELKSKGYPTMIKYE